MRGLIQDGRNAVEISLARRGVGQGGIDRQRWRRHILPKNIVNVEGVRQGFDALGVELLQLIDVFEDGAEMASHRGKFGVGKLQSREMGYPANFFW
jgi:hypothetical protein